MIWASGNAILKIHGLKGLIVNVPEGFVSSIGKPDRLTTTGSGNTVASNVQVAPLTPPSPTDGFAKCAPSYALKSVGNTSVEMFGMIGTVLFDKRPLKKVRESKRLVRHANECDKQKKIVLTLHIIDAHDVPGWSGLERHQNARQRLGAFDGVEDKRLYIPSTSLFVRSVQTDSKGAEKQLDFGKAFGS
ncbi:hypothetical protein RP20_CCG022533 [Aedes albopictus]|nr:hypothetical protein RP20_CCG022533 [Aedes albopictus]